MSVDWSKYPTLPQAPELPVLNTFILASDNMMIFLSGKENFTGMELVELFNQINPAPIYEHFQRGAI